MSIWLCLAIGFPMDLYSPSILFTTHFTMPHYLILNFGACWILHLYLAMSIYYLEFLLFHLIERNRNLATPHQKLAHFRKTLLGCTWVTETQTLLALQDLTLDQYQIFFHALLLFSGTFLSSFFCPRCWWRDNCRLSFSVCFVQTFALFGQYYFSS